MAKYQILYWDHIPLSVRATDENGTVRLPLSGRFVEALKTDTEDYTQVMHSSSFRWTGIQEREGSAAEVATAIAKELMETWDEAEASALFNRGELYTE
jgi:hypothetical protein